MAKGYRGRPNVPDAPAWCQWLQQTGVGGAIRQSLWLFPVIETIHLLGMAALVATITAFDLRLLGWIMPGAKVTMLARRLLPWVWMAFALQVVTGLLLFSSEAVKVYGNPAFRWKLVLILIAGVQALLFQLLLTRSGEKWDDCGPLPMGIKLAGMISILLWAGVVAAGRFIGFV